MQAIRWSKTAALRMSLIALLPFTLILLGQVQAGLVMSIGMIPAAVISLPPERRTRWQLVVVSGLLGVSMIAGSVLAQNSLMAIAGIAAIAFGAAYLTSTNLTRLAGHALALCVPLVGIGLSYPHIEDAFAIALVILAGGVWAYLVTLLSPDIEGAKPRRLPPVPRSQAVSYGIIFALVGVIAAGVPLLLDWDHAGWIAGAALLVMRPSWELEKTQLRGRLISVLLGALLAAVILLMAPPPWVVGLLMGAVIIIAGATQESRWYITPAFTTFIVFFVLLYIGGSLETVSPQFVERVVETTIGVGVAAIFGCLAALMARRIVLSKTTTVTEKSM